MGNIDPVKVIANVATGGLYGVGEGAAKAIDTGRPLAGAADALASWGPFGNVAQPTIGTKNTLMAQSAVAGGALGAASLGGAAAGGAASGAGAAGEGMSPFIVNLPGGGVGMFTPGIGEVTPIVGGVIGGGASNGMSALGAAAGAQSGYSAAGQIGGLFNQAGQSPYLSVPQGGAAPAGGVTPAQQASLGAQQSDPYRGLAPRFEQRIQGKQESPGLSTLPMIPQYYQQ